MLKKLKIGQIVKGDALQLLPELPDNSVQAVITDPPYDLSHENQDFCQSHFERVSSGHILVFCSPENQWPAPRYLFWVKPTSTKNFSRNHGRFVEMIAWYNRGNTFNSIFWANMTGVYHDVLEEARIHEFQKPMSLMERLIRIHTNPGDVVLDPFAGSGTTIKAAEHLGRRYMGAEING